LSLMESKLELKSELGHGSLFYFDLILKTSGESIIEEIPTTSNENKKMESEPENESILAPIKILIVEDNKINMLLIKTIIRNLMPNAILSEANNGLKAIEEFEKITPDIIFMDIQMPQMNGHEATQEIRKLKSGENVPIIALTAGTIKEERDRCLEAGMNDYVTKPIIKGTIEEVIRKWIKNPAV